VQDFRNLEVWQRAYRFTLDAYRATAAFPREELYGLTSQLRRASVSIAANIAEGCGRQSDADFNRFLHVAMGSSAEVECLLMLAADLRLLDRDALQSLHSELTAVRRMRNALIQRLRVPSAAS
jgi:four helix bundle protein